MRPPQSRLNNEYRVSFVQAVVFVGIIIRQKVEVMGLHLMGEYREVTSEVIQTSESVVATFSFQHKKDLC